MRLQLQQLRRDVERILDPATSEDPGLLEEAGADPISIKKLMAGEEQTSEELGALEAIVLQAQRPMLRVMNGRVDVPTGTPIGGWAESLADSRTLDRAIAATGRVEVVGTSGSFVGTAFLVAEDLVLTTRSVASQLVGERTGMDLELARDAIVEFLAESGTTTSMDLRITAALMVHPYWDVAIFRIQGNTSNIAPLALATARPAAFQGRPVAVVGYPARDPRRGDVLDRVMSGEYGVKRVMPGLLIGEQPLPSYGRQVMCLAHDASTSGGTAGAPVLDLESGEVLGVHFAARAYEAGFAVPAWSLLSDARVRETGILSAVKRPELPVLRSGSPRNMSSEARIPWLGSIGADRGVENAWTTTEQSVSDVLGKVLAKHFPDDESLRALMERAGLAEVLDWLPPKGPAKHLGPALTRRERLDPLLLQIWRERPQARENLGSIVSARGLKVDQASMLSATRSTTRSSSYGSLAVEATSASSTPRATDDPGIPARELAAVLQAARGVCRLCSSASGPVASGFLLTPRIVLVPDYAVIDDDLFVEFTDLEPPDATFRRHVARVLALPAMPVVLLELAEDAPAAPIRPGLAPDDGARLSIVHHPRGGPKLIGSARVLGQRGGQLRCRASTLAGSGGGPFLDDAGRAVAMIHSGTPQAEEGPLLSRVLEVMAASHPRLADAVLRWVPDLKPVDPRLESALLLERWLVESAG